LAFSTNNNQQLCGVATWTGLSNLALTVYGFEAGGRGMTAGETFKFRIKLPDNRMLTQVQVTYTAVSGIYTIQGNYVADGIAVLAGFAANYPAVLQPNLLSTAIRCYGASNGSLSVVGGTPNYRYSWSQRTDTSAIIRNLPPNTYIVTVTDANGCTKNTTISIITNGLRDDLAEKCLIRVFPNPVLSDAPLHISVQWHTVMAQPIHVYMRDVFGKIVENSSETIVGNSEQLVSTIHLSAGLYFMVFQVGDFQTIKPIICTP
jgi:hypothetical protein